MVAKKKGLIKKGMVCLLTESDLYSAAFYLSIFLIFQTYQG